ncbi:MAG: non-canonical purine pyrophosphatase, RdgB/HAM1 family [Acidimicrobiaceae bacterium]|nr:non-canonical purine pyrophosphatase, RdgB/HAM1 family [Acidimicrobiaceae bacterium]
MSGVSDARGRLRLVLASANPDKAEEIRQLLGEQLGESVELLERPADAPDVVEDGETLEDNARLKARALLQLTGTAAVADDSGLEVDALGGAPGVRSARYAGEGSTYGDNVAKLLAALAGEQHRSARFRTVALVAFPDGEELVAHGAVEGRIALEPHGAGGFGYDPVFVALEGNGQTFGELDSADKHALSARGRAFRDLAEKLTARLT